MAMFPMLGRFLQKRTPQAQQQANPYQYQDMPDTNQEPVHPSGPVGNEEFNRQQQIMNKGRSRRGMGRM
jgi:hypothetical protein